jgi:hypothetical protein
MRRVDFIMWPIANEDKRNMYGHEAKKGNPEVLNTQCTRLSTSKGA